MKALRFAIFGFMLLPSLVCAEDKCTTVVKLQDGAIVKTRRCIAVQGDKNAPIKVVTLPDQYRLVDGAK